MSADAMGSNQPAPPPATPLVSDRPFPGTVDAGVAWTMPSNSGREAATFAVRGVGSAGQLVC